MNTKRKICVVTGTRAEYGLLQPIMQAIKDDQGLELQLVVTGMHLSPEFGLTY
ncbi:MAG: UDP-N-acetylglucosamine 2-epimerase (hydrolyzing), partial [Candidatus Thioglobus sp.]